GTGTIYCVLTADHVVRGTNSASIGFRFATAPNLFLPYTSPGVVLGADLMPRGQKVDLAVFAVDIPNSDNRVPQVLVPTIIAPNVAAGNQIIQAGYGLMASPMTAPDRYQVLEGTYGTYLTGTNTITRTIPGYVDAPIAGMPGMNYTYDTLTGTFMFTKDAAGMITSGTSYLLPGDSGGPTFESNGMGGLGLVGVHQDTTLRGAPPNRSAQPGDEWDDVNASLYAAFIQQACLLAVPEPSSAL